MFKCSVEIDEKLQNEVNEKMWITSLVSTIVGAIGLGAYIILSIFFDNLLLEILYAKTLCDASFVEYMELFIVK